MSKVRFEDYSKLNGSFPCVINANIKRTSTILSDVANWHTNIEIQHIASGEGFVILDNKKIPVSAGDVITVNSGQIHYTGTESEIVYDCIIVDDGFCRYLGIDEGYSFANVIKSREAEEKLRRIVAHSCGKKDALWQARLSLYLADSLIALAEQCANRQKAYCMKNGEEIKKAILFIQYNFSDKLTLDKIAKHVLLDKFTLSRIFKKATNMTVFEYINSYRITVASSMIKSGKTVSEAAMLCGYNNLSFFTRTFKKHTGCLPSHYNK